MGVLIRVSIGRDSNYPFESVIGDRRGSRERDGLRERDGSSEFD